MRQKRADILVIIFTVTLLLGGAPPASAAQEETLPAFHWSYAVIDHLRLRGYFHDLFLSQRPFTRGTIARSLLRVQQDVDASRIQPSRSDRWLLDQLDREFVDERQQLSDSTATYWLKTGFFGTLDGVYNAPELAGSGLVHYGLLRAGARAREGVRYTFSLGLGTHWTLYNVTRFDRNLIDDPTYVGKQFKGTTGFTEQAYVQTQYGPVRFKLGRDFLSLGPGKSGHLTLSNNAGAFDLYQVEFAASFLKFTAFGAQLDETATDSLFVPGQGPANPAHRFLNGHRLDIKIGRWAQIGLTELVLYGGLRRSFELAYVNPVNFYHSVALNDEAALGRPANVLASVDLALFPVKNVKLYSELLIDDVKVEKVNLSDLEPNRIGLIAGLSYANPLGLGGFNLHTEYARVSNRTYNVYFNDWERYLHRNRPTGYFLGNNVDRFEIGGEGWVTRGLHLASSYEHLRQGKDNINSPYNTDYLNVPSIDLGYSEPFPFGPVQRTHALNLSIKFVPSIDIRVQADLRLAKVTNFAFTGVNRNQVQLFKVGVSLNYDHIWKWK